MQMPFISYIVWVNSGSYFLEKKFKLIPRVINDMIRFIWSRYVNKTVTIQHKLQIALNVRHH